MQDEAEREFQEKVRKKQEEDEAKLAKHRAKRCVAVVVLATNQICLWCQSTNHTPLSFPSSFPFSCREKAKRRKQAAKMASTADKNGSQGKKAKTEDSSAAGGKAAEDNNDSGSDSEAEGDDDSGSKQKESKPDSA